MKRICMKHSRKRLENYFVERVHKSPGGEWQSHFVVFEMGTNCAASVDTPNTKVHRSRVVALSLLILPEL